MAEKKMWIDRSTLEEIGDAIRSKKGTTALIPVPELANEIKSIAGGGEIVEVIPEGYIKPAGTKAITENGSHDVAEYASVNVNVPTESGGTNIETQEKSVTVTANGTTEVLPDAGYALSKVTITTAVKQNYCLVRFYNDDRTTLLYEVFVPYGSSAVYAGDVPITEREGDYVFSGFEPAADNVTADLNCYAVYEQVGFEIGALESMSWQEISALSQGGIAANYFAIGDTKSVYLSGTIGTLAIDTTLSVYILGFNHNGSAGITFGTFKSGGKDVAICDGANGANATDGTKYFNMNHWGNHNYGGWAASDLRYDILGSTDVAPSGYGAEKTTDAVGYDATANCATNPVANTLMAALPAELRAVMQPMITYADSKGNSSKVAANVTASVDYLPLLAEYEIFGTRTNANDYERKKQERYAYYAAGNSPLKHNHSAATTAVIWWTRSAYYNSAIAICTVNSSAKTNYTHAQYSFGLAPIFLV